MRRGDAVALQVGQAAAARVEVASIDSPGCFEVIFDRHYPAIRSYLRTRVSAAVADELASETFVIAFRRRTQYKGDLEHVGPWLFGIATNLMRRCRRQESRELRAYGRVESLEFGNQPQPAEHTIEPQLAQAVRSLSPRDRDVLFLFACAELSYDEIAQALEIPVGTVRSRLARARSSVRERLNAAP